MKDWEAYIIERADTELWGLILLDHYWRQRKSSKVHDTNAFLEDILPRIPVRMDLVRYHKVLLSVCVQLLEENFKEIFKLSVQCLKRNRDALGKEALERIVAQYDEFGQGERFLEEVRKEIPLLPALDAEEKLNDRDRTTNEKGERKIVASSHSRLSLTLDDLIQEALSRISAYLEGHQESNPKRYDDRAFKESALKKASRVLQHVPDEVRRSRTLYISLGGADAEELFALLSTTGSKEAVLLEKNDQSVKRAEAKASANGYSFATFTGDLMEKIDDAMEYAEKRRKDGRIQHIVVTAHAVIHELYTRSPKFDLHSYFSKLRAADVVVGREPIAPYNWPELVILSGAFSADKYLRLAEIVRDKVIRDDSLLLIVVNDKSVKIQRSLCMETLTKAFYSSDIMYELGEYTTRINPDDLLGAMSVCLLETHEINSEMQTSESISRYWSQFALQVMTPERRLLDKPISHLSYFALKKGLH